MTKCPFCDIAENHPELHSRAAEIIHGWSDSVFLLTPLNPVCNGHRLIIPKAHTVDAMADPAVTGEVFRCAAELARFVGRPCNLITSVRAAATQTVPHLHVHYVPRKPGDGLHLPWTRAEET